MNQEMPLAMFDAKQLSSIMSRMSHNNSNDTHIGVMGLRSFGDPE